MKLYTLEFEGGFDEYDDWARGYRSHVLVTLVEEGYTYRIAFFTPYRAQSELQQLVKQGEPCFFETGLVIIPEITLEQMEKSIAFLIEQEFFDGLQPIRKSTPN